MNPRKDSTYRMTLQISVKERHSMEWGPSINFEIGKDERPPSLSPQVANIGREEKGIDSCTE